MDIITIINCRGFSSIIINGELTYEDKQKIIELQSKLSYDEYAGYSPEQQKIYLDIDIIAKKYKPCKIIKL